MKFYITQQTKEELESEIAKLEGKINSLGNSFEDYKCEEILTERLYLHKEILSNSIVLPVEKDWEDVAFSYEEPILDLTDGYPNGVIIQKD